MKHIYTKMLPFMAALIVISCGSCASKDEIKPLTEGGSMKLTSTAFADGEKMPQEFAKLGANHIPPLEINGVPEGTKSLAIIVHDPDAPLPGGFYHWTLWNIPPQTTSIGEGNVPSDAVEGETSWGTSGYNGPQPPFGTHRYIFYLYALDMNLSLPAGSSVKELKAAIKGHAIEAASLTGMFGAKDNP